MATAPRMFSDAQEPASVGGRSGQRHDHGRACRIRAIELQKCVSVSAHPWWHTPRANQAILESEDGIGPPNHRPG